MPRLQALQRYLLSQLARLNRCRSGVAIRRACNRSRLAQRNQSGEDSQILFRLNQWDRHRCKDHFQSGNLYPLAPRSLLACRNPMEHNRCRTLPW